VISVGKLQRVSNRSVWSCWAPVISRTPVSFGGWSLQCERRRIVPSGIQCCCTNNVWLL